MCVLLGNVSEKTTATKFIVQVSLISVLLKFYEKINKRPFRKSKN